MAESRTLFVCPHCRDVATKRLPRCDCTPVRIDRHPVEVRLARPPQKDPDDA